MLYVFSTFWWIEMTIMLQLYDLLSFWWCYKKYKLCLCICHLIMEEVWIAFSIIAGIFVGVSFTFTMLCAVIIVFHDRLQLLKQRWIYFTFVPAFHVINLVVPREMSYSHCNTCVIVWIHCFSLYVCISTSSMTDPNCLICCRLLKLKPSVRTSG